MAQQQLGQPMKGTHQIAAKVLPRADEIAQRLLVDRSAGGLQLPA
jgi:hypothetical protein